MTLVNNAIYVRNYGVEVSKVFKKGMTIGCIAPASKSDESLDARYNNNMRETWLSDYIW